MLLDGAWICTNLDTRLLAVAGSSAVRAEQGAWTAERSPVPALVEVRERSPIPFELDVGKLPVVDDTRTLTAYLVVSEAVANALKHAHASHLNVSIHREGTRLAVRIVDDGIGGVPADAQLPALRDRVLSVGGQLGVASPPGSGTTITALI